MPDRYVLLVILSSFILPDVDSTHFVYSDLCFWNLFSVLISPVAFGLDYRLTTHGLLFCFVALIGLIPGFDLLPVTTFIIWPDMDLAAPNPDSTREDIRLQGQQMARQAADLRQLTQSFENINAQLKQMAKAMSAQQARPPPIPKSAPQVLYKHLNHGCLPQNVTPVSLVYVGPS